MMSSTTATKVITDLSSSDVQLSKINQVGQILLNRPKQLNALNYAMVKQMQKQLEYCENDKDIKCIVIKGSGEQAFCAGGDVKSIREDCIGGKRERAMEFFREDYKLNYHIANCRKPYVALINGITMGGGVGVSIHGKYRVASEKTVFAMPETLIGFFADVGGTYFLSRLADNLGIYLVLTGHRLKGADTRHVGIATHYATPDKYRSLEERLYSESGELSEKKVDEILQTHSEQLDAAKFGVDRHKVRSIFGETSLEKILEGLTRDDSEWSRQQLKQMSKMSPTSLKVAIKQLHMGRVSALLAIHELERFHGGRSSSARRQGLEAQVAAGQAGKSRRSHSGLVFSASAVRRQAHSSACSQALNYIFNFNPINKRTG